MFDVTIGGVNTVKSIAEEFGNCEFVITPNGRITCAKHVQPLLYAYFDGSFLCQVGEDEAIIKIGGIHTFNSTIAQRRNISESAIA